VKKPNSVMIRAFLILLLTLAIPFQVRGETP
jgi:hypothetical protein